MTFSVLAKHLRSFAERKETTGTCVRSYLGLEGDRDKEVTEIVPGSGGTGFVTH